METIEKQTNEQEVIAKLNERLGQLKAASEIAVTDQESLIRSAAVKLDLEAYMRAVENAFEPELAPAEEKVRRLKISMSSLIQPAKQWLTALVNRQREWSAEEKRKAQREQDEINRQNQEKIDRANAKAREEAKAKHAKIPEPVAAPVVAVEPNIPKVAGVRNQTFYYAEVTDPQAILVAFLRSVKDNKIDRIEFLGDFIQVNESAVSKFARDTKDPEKVMKLLPGVRAWSKG